MTGRILATMVAMLAVAPVAAQSAQAPTAASVPAPPAKIAIGTRVGGVPSGYDDGGRRDPFVSLIVPKRTSTIAEGGRPRTGLAAVALADITVRGVIKNGPTMIAILESPDRQSFVARLHDRLLDASVQSIDGNGVIFVASGEGTGAQQVRKTLRPTGEEVQ